MSEIKKIVVGVDGSDESRDALAWALREAEHHQSAVRVVTAYEAPRPVAASYGSPQPDVVDETRDTSAALARRCVDETISSLGVDRDQVELSTVAGKATDVLLDAADDADLLVVGHRGEGGFARLLIGSVAQQCVAHATCPVTVVRRRQATG